jgi:hypothetical protein
VALADAPDSERVAQRALVLAVLYGGVEMRRLLCLLFGCPLVRTGIGRMCEDYVWRHEYQCRRCKKTTWE